MNKTVPTDTSVDTLLASLDTSRRTDSEQLIELMQDISGEKPVLWGTSIVGFGTYHYQYASGREGDWMKIGFSPRKAAFSLYLSCDLAQLAPELAQLGTFTHGKGCLYIKRLADVDLAALRALLAKAYTIPNTHGGNQ